MIEAEPMAHEDTVRTRDPPSSASDWLELEPFIADKHRLVEGC